MISWWRMLFRKLHLLVKACHKPNLATLYAHVWALILEVPNHLATKASTFAICYEIHASYCFFVDDLKSTGSVLLKIFIWINLERFPWTNLIYGVGL